MNVLLVFPMISIPQNHTTNAIGSFSCVSYDSYVEKATAIITEGMTESQINPGWAG
jgi:hypothetical protein